MVEPKKGQEKREISWREIIKAVDVIASKINAKHFNSIYPIPRGGLIPAVLLSHRLNLPIIDKSGINSKTLVVDDICDSGETLKVANEFMKYKTGESITAATLYKRKTSNLELKYYYEEIDKEWLVMPWEVK